MTYCWYIQLIHAITMYMHDLDMLHDCVAPFCVECQNREGRALVLLHGSGATWLRPELLASCGWTRAGASCGWPRTGGWQRVEPRRPVAAGSTGPPRLLRRRGSSSRRQWESTSQKAVLGIRSKPSFLLSVPVATSAPKGTDHQLLSLQLRGFKPGDLEGSN